MIDAYGSLMELSYKKKRRPFEFSDKTRQIAREKAGFGEDEYCEVHHKMQVAVAMRLGLPPELVRSPENAIALTHDEHFNMHNFKMSDRYIADMINEFVDTFPEVASLI